MKFSKTVDYKGRPHFVCKTGRKRIRILEPGLPYEKSFVVPLKLVSNRRPSEFAEGPTNCRTCRKRSRSWSSPRSSNPQGLPSRD